MKLAQLNKSKLLKETLVYGLTNALYSGLPILLMPFLVTIMEPEDYGIVDLFRTISLILTPILGLSTVQSIARFYFDLKTTDFKKFVSSILVFHFFTAILGIIITLLVLNFQSKYFLIVLFSIVFFFFNQCSEALLSIYRVKKQPKYYLFLRVGNVVLDLILLASFYFVYTDYDWKYRVIPNVLSTVVVGLIAIALLLFRYQYKAIFIKSFFKLALSFSAPLILHMIAGYMMNLGDRFFITYFLSEKELGRYAVSYQFGQTINFFFTSFNLAWTPTFYEWMIQKRYKDIHKIRKIIFIILPIIGVFIIGGGFFLLNFIPNFEKYNVSIKLVSIIVTAYIFMSYYKFEANHFFYYKKTLKLSYITIFSAILSVGINLILIPKLGIDGAAYTTLITALILFILVYKLKHEKSKDYIQ